MNIALIALLAALLALAVWRALRRARRGGGCCGERERVARRTVADRNTAHYPYRVELKIGGMTCDNCARRVENALNALEGVWASIRIDGCRAKLRCKLSPDESAIRRAVREAGYVVAEYSAPPQ